MKKLILFIITILLCTLFACNNEEKPTEETNTSKKLLTLKSETGAIIAALESNKEHFKKLEPIEFKLKLTDKKAGKIENAQVTIDLIMPGMAMPKNEIMLKESEKGIYTGLAIFTMKGKWQLNISINSNNKKEIVSFELIVE